VHFIGAVDEHPEGPPLHATPCAMGDWKHTNDVVFNGAIPSFNRVIRIVVEESKLWVVAGLFRGDVETFLADLLRRVGSE
jgi:hypothetical protein